MNNLQNAHKNNNLQNTHKKNNSHLFMTQYDISKLYCSLFEKLGCVILMMMKGNNEKPTHYLKRIKFLIKSIKHKMPDVTHHDRQHDLDIMLINLDILSKHVQKDINHKKNIVNKTIKNNNNAIEYDATLCGLHKWYESAFAKLGWMLLAHNKDDSKRVSEYIRMLHSLHKSIISRHNNTENSDLKIDLVIMKDNIEILLSHAQNDFM